LIQNNTPLFYHSALLYLVRRLYKNPTKEGLAKGGEIIMAKKKAKKKRK